MQKETFYFKNCDPICLTGSNIYNAGESKYNNELRASRQSWHLITILHRNKQYSKLDILQAIFQIVGDNEFFPVGYKEGTNSDYFLVRQCWNAIDKLFSRKLYLEIPKSRVIVKMQINLNAAPYKFGQISPVNKLHEAIGIQFKNIIKYKDGIRNVLDLENINNHSHLDDVFINLGNKEVFQQLCNYMKQPALNILSTIGGIILSRNAIRSLEGLKAFRGARFQMINLKENNIQSVQELNNLKNFQFEEIYLAGNNVCKRSDFRTFMKTTFPNLKKSDIESNPIVPFERRTSHNVNEAHGAANKTKVIDGNGIPVKDYSTLQRFRRSRNWHKIIVEHQGKFSKEEIAQQFFIFFAAQDSAHDFILCYYKVGTNEDNFLVRNCFEHLENLINADLRLMMLENQEILPLRILMDYAPFENGQIEHDKLIFDIMPTKCYNPLDRCLYLEAFNSKPEMKNVYINIGNPKVYGKILQNCARKYINQIIEVHLGHNHISNCNGLKVLNSMENLKVLLLNNNRIRNIKELQCISQTSINNLTLDGNPLCQNYSLPKKYIEDVCELFPNLKTLDGIGIESANTLMLYKKNFICSLNAFDITEQFVGNYFHAYDSDKREVLADMYNSKAILTICFNYKPKKSMDHERFEIYKDYDRNLAETSSNIYRNVFYNHEKIAKVFIKLPRTEHDLFSFTTDTTIYSENRIVITVSGVFKDISENSALDPDIMMAFYRTFRLIPSGNSKIGVFKGITEYEILNDQLIIVNPTENQTKNSFKFCSPEINLTCTAKDNDDKIAYMVMLQQLTKLKEIWVTKCLDEAGWDFEKALSYFAKEMEQGAIPKQAFLENS